MRRRRLIEMTVAEAAADMRRRYGRCASARARRREEAAESESTAAFYQRVGNEIERQEFAAAEAAAQ